MPSPAADLVWHILCWIYTQLGKNCAFLEKNVNLAAKSVKQTYEDERPLILSNEEKQAFLDKLTELENQLKGPDNPADPGATDALFEFIALARQDLAT